MALVLSGERPATAAASNPLGLIVAWFAKVRAGYAQRQALQDLLDLIYGSRTWKLHSFMEKMRGRE